MAQRKPVLPPLAAAAPALYQTAMGVPGVTLPHDPIRDQPTYEAAKSAFEALPRIRILFDNGAGGAPGAPVPGFERTFNRFPIPSTKPRSWFLGDQGTLRNKPPKKGRKGGQRQLHLGQGGATRRRLRGDQHRLR